MVKEQFGKGKAACWVFPCALMTLRKPFSNCHPSTWSALENPESNERNSRKYKRKKWGSSVPLSLFIMLLKSFITQAFLSFICCLLCQKKKIRKVTRKRGRISYQHYRGCCHIPSLLIYSYSVAHFLRHFSLYPYKDLQKKWEETEVWRPSVDFKYENNSHHYRVRGSFWTQKKLFWKWKWA